MPETAELDNMCDCGHPVDCHRFLGTPEGKCKVCDCEQFVGEMRFEDDDENGE